MENQVVRPEAPEKKIRTSDDFELCYLRHQYVRRVKYNPTEAEMAPYIKIVEHFANNTFYTYFNLFKAVGMYQEDIINIGRVHIVSFLGLYSLENNYKKKYEFIVSYLTNKNIAREPNAEELEQKNKANFTCFLKQRMEDLVRVCRQKVKNVRGQLYEEYFAFCGLQQPPKYPGKILKSPEEYGFKKIDFPTFKSVRKKAGVRSDAAIFQFDNMWYVALVIEQKSIEIDDLVGSEANPYDNVHNTRPDELLEEKQIQQLSAEFNQKYPHQKRTVLRNFIAKNQNRDQYKEEVATAKRLLRSLGD